MAFNVGLDLGSLIPPLLGLFGGGGRRGPTAQDELYAKWGSVIDEAMRLYSTTDLASIDKGSLDQYATRRREEAAKGQDSHQARLASAGYDPEYFDTEKSRALSRFDNEAAKDISGMEAELTRSRPARQLGLLPNPNSIAGGFEAAARTDAYRDNLDTAQWQNLMQFGLALAPMFKRQKRTPSGGGSYQMPAWLMNAWKGGSGGGSLTDLGYSG